MPKLHVNPASHGVDIVQHGSPCAPQLTQRPERPHSKSRKQLGNVLQQYSPAKPQGGCGTQMPKEQ
jgi:hypothetical protein